VLLLGGAELEDREAPAGGRDGAGDALANGRGLGSDCVLVIGGVVSCIEETVLRLEDWDGVSNHPTASPFYSSTPPGATYSTALKIGGREVEKRGLPMSLVQAKELEPRRVLNCSYEYDYLGGFGSQKIQVDRLGLIMTEDSVQFWAILK
jgi:hypothetical protein